MMNEMNEMNKTEKMNDVSDALNLEDAAEAAPENAPDVILAALKLFRAMRRRPAHRDHSFPPAVRRTLCALAKRSGMNSRELCELLDVRPSSLSELLARMEAEGLIARCADDTDRRVTRITLTETGAAEAARLTEARQAERDQLSACFTPEEAAEFCRLSDKLSAHLESLMPEEGRRGGRGGHGGHGGCGRHTGPMGPRFRVHGMPMGPGFAPRKGCHCHGFRPQRGPHCRGMRPWGFRPQMPGFGPQMMGFRPQMPGFGPQMMGFRPGFGNPCVPAHRGFAGPCGPAHFGFMGRPASFGPGFGPQRKPYSPWFGPCRKPMNPGFGHFGPAPYRPGFGNFGF